MLTIRLRKDIVEHVAKPKILKNPVGDFFTKTFMADTVGRSDFTLMMLLGGTF